MHAHILSVKGQSIHSHISFQCIVENYKK